MLPSICTCWSCLGILTVNDKLMTNVMPPIQKRYNCCALLIKFKKCICLYNIKIGSHQPALILAQFTETLFKILKHLRCTIQIKS